MHIVLVDDSTDHLELLAELVEELRPGARLSLVDDGTRLPALLDQITADLVMMDLLMPTVNGYDLVFQIRQHPACLHLPIIAVSGLREPNEEQVLREAGFNDKLAKPFDLDELDDLLNRYLPG